MQGSDASEELAKPSRAGCWCASEPRPGPSIIFIPASTRRLFPELSDPLFHPPIPFSVISYSCAFGRTLTTTSFGASAEQTRFAHSICRVVPAALAIGVFGSLGLNITRVTGPLFSI